MKVHPDVAGKQLYAAAGPQLRVAMGGTVSVNGPDPWRGRTVRVKAKSGLSVLVTLSDWCLCTGSGSSIDLYYDAWKALGGPVNPVTISW
jgi:hypothetical protein